MKNTVIALKPLINGSSNKQLHSETVAIDPDNMMITQQTENTIAEVERLLLVQNVPQRGEYYFITWLTGQQNSF